MGVALLKIRKLQADCAIFPLMTDHIRPRPPVNSPEPSLQAVNQRLADLGLRGPDHQAMSQAPLHAQYQPRRTGGTNVDPVSVHSGSGSYVDDWRDAIPHGHATPSAHSRLVSNWDVSRGSVASDEDSVERLTFGGNSLWTARGV